MSPKHEDTKGHNKMVILSVLVADSLAKLICKPL